MRSIGYTFAALLFAVTVGGCNGDKKDGAGTTGGGAMSTADLCKLIETKATAEGGQALEMWNSNLKNDCVKEMDAERAKQGEEAWNKFTQCVNTKATMTAAMEECEPGK